MTRRFCRAALAAVFFLSFLSFLSMPETALAHGAGYRQSSQKPVSLEFSYSTGETMSYLEAQVFSPRDEKFAFQSGRTDEAGRFAFTPDCPGRWRVIVRDEEGHSAEAEIDVTEDFFQLRMQTQNEGNLPAIPGSGSPQGTELLIRAALGVSLLLNIAAAVSAKRHATGSEK